jgi:transcriptional regulator with XRE-family HTH domain
MEAHWTERSIEDYRFRIVADFISQIEEVMESQEISRDELAKILDKTKGRISQILNNPGNITFDNIVKLARAIKMKVSLVAYEDDDPTNKKGPINSEIFKICWEKMGKPSDFWSIKEVDLKMKTANSAVHKLNNFGKYIYMGSFDKFNISKTAILKDPDVKTIEQLTNAGYGG